MKRSGEGQPPAYVFGSSLNALGVVRCLGRRGIRVRTVQRNKDEMPSWSRFGSPLLIEPTANPIEVVGMLIKAAAQEKDKPVLIPTGDVDVAFMSENRDVLREHFQFVLSDGEILDSLLQKEKFYLVAIENNLPVPKTYFGRDVREVREISRQITYPCVIKPRYSPLWQHPRIAKSLGYTKILECDSPEDLMAKYGSLEIQAQDVVLQEMIPGGEEKLHDVYLYIGAGGMSVASFCLQKLRTVPTMGRGAGTLVHSTHNEKIARMGLSFLQAIGYRGPAAVCFKQHPETGEFLSIEVNARLSLHHSLAAHCGIDFAYLLYLDSLNTGELTANSFYPSGVKWIAAFYDTASFLQHRAEDGLSFTDWLQSWRGPKIFGDWSWDDPWPFMRECLALLPSVTRKIWFRYASSASNNSPSPKLSSGPVEK